MPEPSDWSFPDALQPRPDQVAFDLASALDAVVSLRAEVPEDAFTAPLLGTERTGSGVVIREDGLVLTIGYLVTEAETIWLATNSGKVVPGHALGFDQATGFGLIQALGRLDVPALARGAASSVAAGDEVIVAAQGGRAHALKARIFAKREFAGYWEYLLDEAIFTVPGHPHWSGAALIGSDGRLLGIGSLLVEERLDRKKVQGNMFVPAELLQPILDDMLTTGRARRPTRPWLGMYTADSEGKLIVGGLAKRGPAERAGVREGDQVIAVAGEGVLGLPELYRRVWTLGGPGAEIPLTVMRKGQRVEARIISADRADFLRKPKLH